MHHIDQSVVEATARLLWSPWVMHITNLVDAVFKMLTGTFYVAATVTHFKPTTLHEFGLAVAGGPKVPQENSKLTMFNPLFLYVLSALLGYNKEVPNSVGTWIDSYS